MWIRKSDYNLLLEVVVENNKKLEAIKKELINQKNNKKTKKERTV